MTDPRPAVSRREAFKLAALGAVAAVAARLPSSPAPDSPALSETVYEPAAYAWVNQGQVILDVDDPRTMRALERAIADVTHQDHIVRRMR